MLDLQQEIRDRSASKPRKGDEFAPAGRLEQDAAAEHGDTGGDIGSEAFAGSVDRPSGALSSAAASKTSAMLDEAQIANQKLKRELADVKAANAKLVLTNSQLEDDFTHLQRRYDDEKRAHLNGKKLHLPKVQKV